MIDPCTLSRQPYSNRILPLSPIVSFVSVMVGLGGLASVLALTACSSATVSDSPSPTPTLRSFSNEELKNYARTVLTIEPIRQSAFKEIQQINKAGNVPLVACDRHRSIADLSRDIQNIAVNYCTQAKKIAESNGLTMSQFNGMTAIAESDPDLQRRIQNELISLQR